MLERIPLEILNQGKYELIDEIYAPDFVEHWGLVDQLGLFVQLGIVPAPGQVPVTA